MKVALTGGAGFIGSCLIHRLLDDGHTVQALTRNPDKLEAVFPQVVPFAADLASPTSALNGFAEDCDVFFHCAGELSNQTAMTALHVEGTQRLIEHLSGRVPRWVQLSSVGAYGARHSGHVDEDTVENPVGEYEITKAKSDQLVINAAHDGSFEASILRPANVIGQNMTNQSLFALMGAIDRGLFFYVGAKGAMTNYIAVEDVVEALLLCGDNNQTSQTVMYNLAHPCSLEAAINAMKRGMGKTSSSPRIPRWIAELGVRTMGRIPGFPLTKGRLEALTSRVTYQTSQIERELGYTFSMDIEDYLFELANWWKQQK